jgi:hypothetical protein
MQISCGIHPKVSQEKHLRVAEKIVRADHPGFGSAERERSGGGASDGRPCAHAVVDTTEVLGLRGGGVYQRQECHHDCTKVMDRAKNFVGQNFWARGYYVSTVGRDEAQIREYIRQQEKEDQRLDQLKMFE